MTKPRTRPTQPTRIVFIGDGFRVDLPDGTSIGPFDTRTEAFAAMPHRAALSPSESVRALCRAEERRLAKGTADAP